MEYVTMRDISEIAILQAFGMPGSLVGQRFAQERNTFTNYGEARTSFYQDTISPLWARLDDVFTSLIAAGVRDTPNRSHCSSTLSKVVRCKRMRTRCGCGRIGALAGGIMVNEFRRKIGLADVSGGDVFLLPSTSPKCP
jgi:hypothetical protein